MEKKIIVMLLFILLFVPSMFAVDTFSDYEVTPLVNLGQNVTVMGRFLDDANLSTNVLCEFYLLDTDNILINRADDQFTGGLGDFAVRFRINEPDFKRGSNYKVKTVCSGAEQTADFNVIQRENIAHSGYQEFNYITDRGNMDTVAIWIVMIIFIVIFLGAFWFLYKWQRAK